MTKTLSNKFGASVTLIALVVTCTISCASYHSVVPTSDSPSTGGLGYYMPKRDLIVEVTIGDEGQVENVSFERSAAYPDLNTYFELQPRSNWLGKTMMDISISSSGLLTTANSKTETNLSEIARSLATFAGQQKADRKFFSPDEHLECANDSTYTFLVDIEGNPPPICGLTLGIEPLGSDRRTNHLTDPSGARSGIYYRQEIPYRVTLSGTSRSTRPTTVDASALFFSPSRSGTMFLPISRTFFGTNEAKISLTDGTPTGYNQTIDGEAVALLKLPAEILSAYFEAIGSTFDSFKANAESESNALEAELQLELQRIKFEACIEAIQNEDSDQITALDC